MKTLILIPVYNCYDRLSEMLPVLAAREESICVVDDGSADVPELCLAAYGVILIRHEKTGGRVPL